MIEYPEVVIQPLPPLCDCKVREIRRYGGLLICPQYCPKHNVIMLWCVVWKPKDAEELERYSESLINHETLHWILCRKINRTTSRGLDRLSEPAARAITGFDEAKT